MNKSLGILGGLGPLASAEFLKTIYEFNIANFEQQLPACILYSDPKFPDRTDAIAGISDDILLSLLVEKLESLCQLGVDRIVICCITIHYFLPMVPARLREKVVSLIDLIFQEVLTSRTQHLLLCTNGSRSSGVFHKHAQWNLADNFIVFPDDDDQNMIHSFIYQLKNNCSKAPIVSYLETLIWKYQVDSLIVGCTEFHLMTKHLMKPEYNGQQYHIVDPLITLARNIKQFTDATSTD